MSRSILDYFSQNYPDLLALAVQVCAHMTSRPEAGEDVLHQVAVALCQREAELADGGGRTAAQQLREKAPDKASGFLQKLRLVQPP